MVSAENVSRPGYRPRGIVSPAECLVLLAPQAGPAAADMVHATLPVSCGTGGVGESALSEGFPIQADPVPVCQLGDFLFVESDLAKASGNFS